MRPGMNSIDQPTGLQGDGSVVDREVGITGWMWSSCSLLRYDSPWVWGTTLGDRELAPKRNPSLEKNKWEKGSRQSAAIYPYNSAIKGIGLFSRHPPVGLRRNSGLVTHSTILTRYWRKPRSSSNHTYTRGVGNATRGVSSVGAIRGCRPDARK
jgi:hypothetical protein